MIPMTPSLQKFAALLSLFALVSPMFAHSIDTKPPLKPLTQDQRIAHVLNRLGFGARPGDIERVRQIGLDKYIDQQLDPSSINDSVAEAKVKNLEIFNMSTAEVFAKYPNPGALLRQLEGGKKGQAKQQQASDAGKGDATKTPEDQ